MTKMVVLGSQSNNSEDVGGSSKISHSVGGMSDVLVERIVEELDASIDRGRVRYIGGRPPTAGAREGGGD
jgi:hypothetical protein